MTYKRAEVLDALGSEMAAKDTDRVPPLSNRKPKKKETVERGRKNEGRGGDGEEVGYTLKFARQTELFVFLSTQNYLLGICLGDTRGT